MTCSESDCTGAVIARGLCFKHYQRARRAGTLECRPTRPKSAASVRDAVGRKFCPACETWKLETEFSKSYRGTDGLHVKCTRCRGLWRYRITARDYDQMLAAQNGGCAICGVPCEEMSLVVDHDHSCCGYGSSCGRCVRGLLCRDCNLWLGRHERGEASLPGASIYLKSWRDTRVGT